MIKNRTYLKIEMQCITYVNVRTKKIHNYHNEQHIERLMSQRKECHYKGYALPKIYYYY